MVTGQAVTFVNLSCLSSHVGKKWKVTSRPVTRHVPSLPLSSSVDGLQDFKAEYRRRIEQAVLDSRARPPRQRRVSHWPPRGRLKADPMRQLDPMERRSATVSEPLSKADRMSEDHDR